MKSTPNTEITTAPRRRASAIGSTRPRLLSWALRNVPTEELCRLKAKGKNICELMSELRSQGWRDKFEIERLQKDIEGLRDGHRRWREEALMLHRVRIVLENFINEEMKMPAGDPRITKLAKRIDEVSNEALCESARENPKL